VTDPGVEQLLGQALDVYRVQIDQRRRKGRRHGVGQIGGRNSAGSGELGYETGLVACGPAVDVLGRLLFQLAREDQGPTQPWQGHGSVLAVDGSVNGGHGLCL